MIDIYYSKTIAPSSLSTNSGKYVNIKTDCNNYRPIDSLKKEFINQWGGKGTPLFRIVSIETNTGCNFTCTFCPVAKGKDPRPKLSMSWDTLKKIASELEKLSYDDNIFLFCNNEPLLDKRLPKIVTLFRKKCPASRIKVLTNGILLDAELTKTLFDSGLSILEIDNYTDGIRLMKPIGDLIKNSHKFKNNNIVINMRKRDEVLTNRAGTAPNVSALAIPKKAFCGLPFADINIMPDGRITLCCIDALNQCIIGSLAENTLIEIWKSNALTEIRMGLLKNDRTVSKICILCDYNGFRMPPPIPKYI